MKPGFWEGTWFGWSVFALCDFTDVVVRDYRPSIHDLPHAVYVICLPLFTFLAAWYFYKGRK